MPSTRLDGYTLWSPVLHHNHPPHLPLCPGAGIRDWDSWKKVKAITFSSLFRPPGLFILFVSQLLSLFKCFTCFDWRPAVSSLTCLFHSSESFPFSLSIHFHRFHDDDRRVCLKLSQWVWLYLRMHLWLPVYSCCRVISWWWWKRNKIKWRTWRVKKWREEVKKWVKESTMRVKNNFALSLFFSVVLYPDQSS